MCSLTNYMYVIVCNYLTAFSGLIANFQFIITVSIYVCTCTVIKQCTKQELATRQPGRWSFTCQKRSPSLFLGLQSLHLLVLVGEVYLIYSISYGSQCISKVWVMALRTAKVRSHDEFPNYNRFIILEDRHRQRQRRNFTDYQRLQISDYRREVPGIETSEVLSSSRLSPVRERKKERTRILPIFINIYI